MSHPYLPAVIDLVRQAGVSHFAIQTEPPAERPR